MENKTGKYFKYAIGEIILVVIGILIALSINNWNSQKNRSNTEVEILEVMRENLNSDIKDMEINLEISKTALQSTIEVFTSFNNPSYKNDSLNFYFGNLYKSAVFVETTSAYENLKTIGFEIIKNDSLKKNIMHIYSKQYQYIEQLESGHREFHNSKLQPLLIDNMITYSDISAKPVNFTELEKNHRFKETLKFSYGWLTKLIEEYSEIKIEVESLEQQIATELEQRK
jgi:peptide methionine sulfoxide reductase MsrA